MKLLKLLLLLALLAASVRSVNAQEAIRALPEVTSHAPIAYPPLARQARIQGLVHLRITTDGHGVADVATEDGHPLLAQIATINVRTWKFVDHVPGTFEVTFIFRLLQDKVTFLQEPGAIDIAVTPPRDGEGKLDYTLPAPWVLKLKSTRTNIEAPLSLWTYGPWLRGYASSPLNQRRAIRNTHQTGAMLGFDAALSDSYGQRLSFSLIGKKTGDKIQGIFLDQWGTSGTWTAVRSPQTVSATGHTPPATSEDNVIAIPAVTDHKQLEYPWLPFEAQIQGPVRLRVTTNGSNVVKVVTESGEPLLSEAAEANVRTWQFDFHKAGTFEVVFHYRFLEPGAIFFEKSSIVEVSDLQAVTSFDDCATTPTEIWKARFTNPRESAQAAFSLFRGCYLEIDMIDARGKKEESHESHENANVFGFDTTLKTASGQAIKVSVLGTQPTRNRMKGVFLDYSGNAGTWTAARSSPRTSP